MMTPQQNCQSSKSILSTSTSTKPNDEASQKVSANYSSLLTEAISKIQLELHDQFMEYILEELIEFDKQLKCTKNNE